MTETKIINLEEIREKLTKILGPSGWASKLRGFIQSSDFMKILETLSKEVHDGRRFTPPLKQVFRAFTECPVDKLKVVMLGQDPYPHFGTADGLAFSCGNTMKPQPSLVKIIEAVNNTVYPHDPIKDFNPDLTRWSNQGVLLLNSALTCQIDKVGSHYNIWQEFIMYLMDVLNFGEAGMIFVLMGGKAQEFESVISDSHYIIKTTHPAYASYRKEPWDCSDMFNEINRTLKSQNKQTIIWQ